MNWKHIFLPDMIERFMRYKVELHVIYPKRKTSFLDFPRQVFQTQLEAAKAIIGQRYLNAVSLDINDLKNREPWPFKLSYVMYMDAFSASNLPKNDFKIAYPF